MLFKRESRRVLGAETKLRSLRAMVVACGLLVVAAISPGVANAAITPTVTTVYGSSVPGGHGSYTVIQDFDYGAAGTTEDLRKWIIDSPPGLAGNPNAVPYDDRCTLAEFNTTIDPGSDGIPPFSNACPSASVVGSAGVQLARDSDGALIDGQPFDPTTTLTPGYIYLIQTDPEVPTTLATHFVITNSRTRSVIEPVTNVNATVASDADFRLRTIPLEDNADPVWSGPTPAHITKIAQTLNANAGNGATFMTNPMRCDSWNTISYAQSQDDTSNADYDPDPDPDHNHYKKSNVDSKVPTCDITDGFSPTVNVEFSTGKRDSNPQVDFTVNTPWAPGEGGVPKQVATILPATVTTDIDALGTICEIAQRDASACPAASLVGKAVISTPFISAGLTGDVYITRGEESALPNLAVFVGGAIKFRMDAVNRFTGPNRNQIISVFDNLPQVPMTSFKLTIFGGTNTLLRIPACKQNNSRPQDGSVEWTLTDYLGRAVTAASGTAFEECRGVILKRFGCVRRLLNLQPVYLARANVSKAELYIGGKRVKTSRRSPFKFKINVRKYKDGKKGIKVKATYKSGLKASEKSSFRKC